MNQTMRICMISPSFLPVIGGLQFEIKYLVEELADQGIDIYLLSYTNGEGFLRKNKDNFPKFIRLRHNNLLFGTIELYKLIKKISPQLIHLHSAERPALQIAILKTLGLINKPFIITSHGIDIMTYPEIGYGLRLNPLNAFLIKFILKQCTKHIIVGKSMKKFALEAGSGPDKVIEINNGIPLFGKEISEEKRKSILRKLGITSNEYVLVSLSGMRPLKGIEYLVKAMPQILKVFPNTKLVLACRGDKYERHVKVIVKSLGIESHVLFTGFITDEEEKIVLIRRSDAFCKPSLLEACSVAILEAMREGKVVIATIPGGIDIITDNKDGVLVPPKDPNSFAEAVIKIFQDKKLRKSIEKSARETVEKFGIKKIANRYISLYKDLLRSK